MKPTVLAIALTFFAVRITAQQACPCVPLAHLWVVEECATWNCAMSASILANGDPYVLSLPAGTNDGRWLVVKRVVGGSYTVAPDAPFMLESFDGAAAAMARFSAAADHAPIVLSAPDGKFLVIMSRESASGKKRAAR